MEGREFILIAATCRSGSTTLQRILNTIPNTNITGENDGAIMHLLRCYNSLKVTNEIHHIAPNIDACIQKHGKPHWYNSFNIQYIKQNIQSTIVNILDNHAKNRILGFKEIRYFDCIDLLDTFVELFPRTKIICHYRQDIGAQSKSGFLSHNADAVQYLTNYNNQVIRYYEKHKNYCYLSTMEDMLHIHKMKQMFLFLDKPFNPFHYSTIIQNKLE